MANMAGRGERWQAPDAAAFNGQDGHAAADGAERTLALRLPRRRCKGGTDGAVLRTCSTTRPQALTIAEQWTNRGTA